MFAGEASAPEQPLSLWYRRPAAQWVEALAFGNGRLGGMIYGRIENERIQLNENTLWAAGPYDPSNTNALAALPEARRLVFAGQYQEAEKFIHENMMSKPLREMPYQTLGDLVLNFPETRNIENYRRELNLGFQRCGPGDDTGAVSWENRSGQDSERRPEISDRSSLNRSAGALHPGRA